MKVGRLTKPHAYATVTCAIFHEIPPQGTARSASMPGTAQEENEVKAKRASYLSDIDEQTAKTHRTSSIRPSLAPLRVAPKTSVELVEFFTQSYVKDEFAGVFRPLWDTMHLRVRTKPPTPITSREAMLCCRE
jgi:hypothetical protein